MFTLSRKLNISTKAVFKKYGKDLTITIPGEGKKKAKTISLAAPESLKRNRAMQTDGLTNFDPFSVKYYSVRSNST